MVSEQKHAHMTTLQKLEWLHYEIQNARGFSSNSEYLYDALDMIEEIKEDLGTKN